MKIPVFDGAALEFLRRLLSKASNKRMLKQQAAVCQLFTKNTNSDLLAYLAQKGFANVFHQSRLVCDSFELDPCANEIDNVIEVRSKLAGLTAAEASSEALWAGLCMGPAWCYVRDRWRIQEDFSPNKIKQHYMFGNGHRRSYTRNALARLWWIGHLTVDEGNRADPYVATKFVLEKLDQVVAILERNTSDNKRLSFEIIEGIRQARMLGLKVERNEIRELSKYINIVGGVDVLDMLPDGCITQKLLERARKICPRVGND